LSWVISSNQKSFLSITALLILGYGFLQAQHIAVHFDQLLANIVKIAL
jgi:hypothetical protein